MGKINLKTLMVGSIIPPLVACQAGQLADLAARGFTGTEIAGFLAVSLAVGVVGTFAVCPGGQT
jgi:hypothetical protein